MVNSYPRRPLPENQGSVQNDVIAESSRGITATSSRGESSRAGSKSSLSRGSDRAGSTVDNSSSKRRKRDDNHINGGVSQESDFHPLRSRSSVVSCTVSRPPCDDDSDENASLHIDTRVCNAGLS